MAGVVLMTAAELEALEGLARGQLVLELGAYQGGATVHLCATARRVWSVDHHWGDQETGPGDSLPAYLERTLHHRLARRLVTIVGDFQDLLGVFAPRIFGLVVLDGAHDAPSVERDLQIALPLLRPGGTFAAHDWDRWDVAPALLPQLGPPPRLVDSLAIWPT